MPQINRIRVNNVKYNFGTQYYDDFVMRFNCRNTIYDLANGGGKSLLMLLLMQNMIPNCTLDDKQPIEKLFRQGSGNTCIHSLVEWKLDSCYQQDGFKYMTTGFCARRGRSQDAEDGTDENVLSGDSTASIEYFNYCIFYREFGDYDLKNLPLSSNGERITYNGLKALLRDLEKSEFKYIVKVFDRKGDYQSFISNYGIYESAWEIVRGINKTEGHVRTYFESNYKTSRKVVEDLLIEEIIQKSYNNRLSVNNDEGKMAKTLLDIKDKLVELSKKHSQIGAYDSQIAAVLGFKDYLLGFEDFYNRKEKTLKNLYNLLVAAVFACSAKEKESDCVEQLIQKIVDELAKEREAIAVAEVMSEQNSLVGLEALVKQIETERKSIEKEISGAKERLALLESAGDYKDYLEYEKSYNEIKVALDNHTRQDEDIVLELKKLAGRYKHLHDKSKKSLEEKKALADNNVKLIKNRLEAARENLRFADKENAGLSSLKENLERTIQTDEEQLNKLLLEAELMVAENAEVEKRKLDAELAVLKETLALAEKECNSLRDERVSKKESANASKALISILSVQRDSLKEKEAVSKDNRERMDNIRAVYSAPDDNTMLSVILDTYRRMDKEYDEIEASINELSHFITNAKNGTYVCKDADREKLKAYLLSQYGDDVVEGHEWFKALSVSEKRDVLKRAPFIEYAFIIKNDFERVKADETLINFGRGGNCYPVVSEQVLIDTKLEINKELIVFALKDMSFLRDDARLEAEIKMAQEEYDTLTVSLHKLADRKELVWSDYSYVLEYLAVFKNADISLTIENLEDKISSEEKNLRESEEETLLLSEKLGECEGRVLELRKEQEELLLRRDILKQINDKNQTIAANYSVLKEYQEKLQLSIDNIEKAMDKTQELSKELDATEDFAFAIDEKLKELGNNWEIEYAAYYDETFNLNISEDAYQYSMEELETRFLGLKSALNGKNSDVADKEALMNHLKLSMNKCVENIEYRGFELQQIKNLTDSGELMATDAKGLREKKDELSGLEKKLVGTDAEFNDKTALLNRLEGSIAHGINQIETKFGEYREFECDNPDTFIEQHKALIKKLEDNIRLQEKKKKEVADSLKDLLVCRKDLERIVTDAGLSVPTEVKPEDVNDLPVKLSDYEAIHKEYAAITKLEYKKVDEFAKNKQKLIDLLVGFNAVELADEVRLSVNLPENADKTRDMIKSLDETNTFIELEKERVAKGIEDMERIKDNFENRCIQTCSNIKTELDRLPQLSDINLDGEQISIISLSIPYIREELYKEKMAAYIDETVVMAESFKDSEERLKYIRNRLTWKRLFSVIVTDMNSIRINLYKRERIKDQSRYLRYEEAVGSTGQSQGIYIQFLIAIINYISNMNCKNNDGGIEGKTIFIDNPFGAAKDIYIWEPIFKMLATNHVQLIVPARGATPAITGRFDVNYILGQKLSDKRQQTVVVDYFSSAKESELEYTRMDYEQATFDFL